MEDTEDESITRALQSRRIPHGRMYRQGGHKKGSGRGGAAIFDPLRAMGRYEIFVQSRITLLEGERRRSSEPSWLEIHELTPNEDGLLGTFSIEAQISGICVLAGSRKGLDKIVQDLQGSEESSSEDELGTAQVNVMAGERNLEELGVSEQVYQISELESEDQRLNKRAQAFEKSTFRNPKFWLRWNAGPTTDGQPLSADADADRGYVVFSNNDCAKFDGSISSKATGWKDVKIHGRKVRPQATPCPLRWNNN